MRYLSLDLGTRRTGVAFYDDATHIVLPLATIEHASRAALLAGVREIVTARGIEHLFVGLPLLPGGDEGAQAGIVRQSIVDFAVLGIPVTAIDERYSTPEKGTADGNAVAACTILTLGLQKVVDK